MAYDYRRVGFITLQIPLTVLVRNPKSAGLDFIINLLY